MLPVDLGILNNSAITTLVVLSPRYWFRALRNHNQAMLAMCRCNRSRSRCEVFTKRTPNSVSGNSADHFALESQLGISEPQRDSTTGVHFQWNRHLDRATVDAQVRGLAPNVRLPGRMQLHRNRTLHSDRLPPVLACETEIVDRPDGRSTPQNGFSGVKFQ
jgi:hypothetical protein